MKNILLLLILPFLLFYFLIVDCSKKEWHSYQDREILLGTFVSIISYDSLLSHKQIKLAVDGAFNRMKIVEEHTNPFNSNSEIGEINSMAGHELILPASPLLYQLLDKSLSIANRTAGAYDLSLWPVFRLWNFGTDSAAVPPEDSIYKYLKKVSYKNIGLEQGKIIFNQKGMGIDLSGISKGYAVEEARKVLLSFGLNDFIIDAGGNLGIEISRVSEVKVYIRHPRKPHQFFGWFPVSESCGIATSGDYQNYFDADSAIYHHILDPATGFPCRNAVEVTVVAADATTADGLSTAFFVMGMDTSLAKVKRDPALEIVYIFSDGNELKYRLSRGLLDNFIRMEKP